MNQSHVGRSWARHSSAVSMGREMTAELLNALCRKGVPTEFAHQCVRISNETPEIAANIFDRAAQVMIDWMPPLVECIDVPTPDFDPASRLKSSFRHHRWSVQNSTCLMELIKLDQKESVRLVAKKDVTTFSVVQFWRGWSHENTLMELGKMGLFRPSVHQIMCLTDFMATRDRRVSIPAGYVSNSLVVPWIFEYAGLPHILGITYNEGYSISMIPIGDYRHQIPTERGPGIDGFAITYPFVMVKP